MAVEINLVTGSRGVAHVTASDNGALNAAIIGSEQVVLNGFAATLTNNNLLTVGEGELSMNGRHIRIDKGSSAELVIENGYQELKRIDVVVCRYVNDGVTEKGYLDVIKGTPGTEATVPKINTGNVLEGVMVCEMPLYHIVLDGIVVKSVTPVYKTIEPYPTMLQELKNELINLFTPDVGAIEINTTGINPSNKYAGTKWVEWGSGRVPIGVDKGQTEFDTVEKTGGEKTVSLIASNIPSHNHSIPSLSGTAASNGAHTHQVSGEAASSGEHKHNVPHSNDAYVTASGARMFGYDSSGNTTAKYTNRYTGKSGAHTHTVSGTAATGGAHDHTVSTNKSTTGNTGNGTAVNNLQPYVTCYMWKRTA